MKRKTEKEREGGGKRQVDKGVSTAGAWGRSLDPRAESRGEVALDHLLGSILGAECTGGGEPRRNPRTRGHQLAEGPLSYLHSEAATPSAEWKVTPAPQGPAPRI